MGAVTGADAHYRRTRSRERKVRLGHGRSWWDPERPQGLCALECSAGRPTLLLTIVPGWPNRTFAFLFVCRGLVDPTNARAIPCLYLGWRVLMSLSVVAAAYPSDSQSMGGSRVLSSAIHFKSGPLRGRYVGGISRIWDYPTLQQGRCLRTNRMVVRKIAKYSDSGQGVCAVVSVWCELACCFAPSPCQAAFQISWGGWHVRSGPAAGRSRASTLRYTSGCAY